MCLFLCACAYVYVGVCKCMRPRVGVRWGPDKSATKDRSVKLVILFFFFSDLPGTCCAYTCVSVLRMWYVAVCVSGGAHSVSAHCHYALVRTTTMLANEQGERASGQQAAGVWVYACHVLRQAGGRACLHACLSLCTYNAHPTSCIDGVSLSGCEIGGESTE